MKHTMKIIDLSHEIEPNMPVYPGCGTPELSTIATVEEDGFLETNLNLSTHTGTHIDAPAHVALHTATLDRLAIDRFVGPCTVIDLTHFEQPEIPIARLEPHENQLKKDSFLLLHTGWSRYWGSEKYFKGYPVLSIEAALWLHAFGLKGVGVDTISVDEPACVDLPVHKILLERTLVIENLTNLNKLPPRPFTLSCLPLKIRNADASPVRAVAMIP